jgi:hypothetical protein
MTHVIRAEKAAHTERIRIEQHSIAGILWFGGWLFTVAFLQLSVWKAVLALVVWPYYIGVALRLTS